MNVVSFSKKIAAVVLPILVVFTVHYIAANLYVKTCANYGFIGFLTSFVTTNSPVCNSLLAIMNATQNSYAMLLTSMAGGFLAFIAF
jgi:hypothetical protein